MEEQITLQQTWPAPSVPRPIVIIGGGDIIRDAHIPAYKNGGLPIAGVFDLNRERAVARVAEIGGDTKVFDSLEEAFSIPNAVFDVATPPHVHLKVLEQLPPGATVLLQKPMGTNYEQAKAIVECCQNRELIAAVNFQLRFSPNMLVIRDLLQQGRLGEIVDVDMQMNVSTPWAEFPFLEQLDRVEIQVHSVHYLDLIRSFIGTPNSVYARTVKHPDFKNLASTKSSMILNYGDFLRVNLSINHNYPFGGKHEDAVLRIQGTAGAVATRIGVSLNYPTGKKDTLEVIGEGFETWTDIPLMGGWFPDAFEGPMNNLQRFAAGEDPALLSPVEDALHSMAVVEACYQSDEQGGTPLPE